MAKLQAWGKKLFQLIHNQLSIKQITASDTRAFNRPTLFYTCISGFLQENPDLLLHMQGVHCHCLKTFSLLPVNSK